MTNTDNPTFGPPRASFARHRRNTYVLHCYRSRPRFYRLRSQLHRNPRTHKQQLAFSVDLARRRKIKRPAPIGVWPLLLLSDNRYQRTSRRRSFSTSPCVIEISASARSMTLLKRSPHSTTTSAFGSPAISQRPMPSISLSSSRRYKSR
jgi:hypothetical protein